MISGSPSHLRAVAAGTAVAGSLHDPLRDAADGAAQVHLAVRWFAGLGVDEPVWCRRCSGRTTSGCQKAEVAHEFLAELLNHNEVRGLLSDAYFSVDRPQVAAWASMKSFRAKDDRTSRHQAAATANVTCMARPQQ